MGKERETHLSAFTPINMESPTEATTCEDKPAYRNSSRRLLAARLFPEPWQHAMRKHAAAVVGAVPASSYLSMGLALARWAILDRLDGLTRRQREVVCRLVRGETLKLRELDYVQASQAFGAGAGM